MRTTKYILIILAVTLIFPFSATATKYAGEFLTIGTGARALGMGGAFTATADDASASFWNPAGLPYIKTQQAIVMHAEQFKDLVNYDCLSYSRPLGEYSALGATFIRLSVPDVPDTRDAWLDANNNGQVDAGELDYSKITYGDDTEMALLLSYSRWLRQGISVGGNVKLIRKSVFDYSAWGFGLDIAGHYKYNDNLSFGVNLQDITTTPLIWNDEAGTTETISPTLKMGVAYSRKIPFGTLTLATDVDWRFEGREEAAQFNMGAISGDLRLGAEYWLKDHLAFRLGSAEGNLTAGAGLKLYMFQIDYAFLGHNDLDNTHRISALVSF
jgi:hypothetical protein